MTDRDLVAKASAKGMLLSTISRLDAAQADRLRQMFAPAAAARAAPAARAVEKPVAASADSAGRTVVRRRIRAEGEEGAPVEAPPAPVAAPVVVAPVAPAPVAVPAPPPPPAPVAVAAPVVPVAAPVVRDDRPRLRRAKAEDLEPPPELQLRPVTPAAVAPAPVVVAQEAPAPAAPVVEAAEAPAAAPAAPVVEVAPAPAFVPPVMAPVEAPAPAPVAPVVEAGAQTTSLGISEIGAAITAPSASTGTSRSPRLIRTKMPEYLVNIPKPVIKPQPVVTESMAIPAADLAPERGVRLPTDRVTDTAARGEAAGRGRKVIYERRRDTGVMSAEDRRRGKKRGKVGKVVAPVSVPKQEKRHLRIEDTITVANLAHQMSVKASEVIKKLFDLGIMATINHALDLDTVELIAGDFGFTVENVGFDLDSFLVAPVEDSAREVQRSPVVTVMGHVDHGKTSLLDAIRKTHTAAREAGGITQHIGAYVADVPGKGRVVFLDTPGHEAFTAMRARGAKATDVIVLVVAADDGVMPQTIEAINHAKAANVPIIVAVNKIDKPGADLDKVRRELADHGVQSEDWGGDTTFCEVSAKTGKGIDKLLEMLALQSEIMDLKARADCDARGLVIESRLEKGRGPVATLLVQQGTLKRGQYVVSGSQYGRVRAMLDDLGRTLDEAGPATPVEVIGFETVSSAGDEFYVVENEKKAKAIVEHRTEKQREKELLKTSKRTLDQLFETMATGETKDLNLIIKADVHGSAEALKSALAKIEHEEVKVRVLHSAVGGVTESDIHLASASKAVIIAFNVKPEAKGKRLADDLAVKIKQYSVIYDAIDDVTALLEGMLTPIIEEVILGHAEVRQTFSVPKLGTIAGCMVSDGVIQRGAKMRLFRGKDLIWEGDIATLKRFKDDVKEVTLGYECGIGLQGFAKINIDDRLECYEFKKTARKLTTVPARPHRDAAV